MTLKNIAPAALRTNAGEGEHGPEKAAEAIELLKVTLAGVERAETASAGEKVYLSQ